jgi:hypothetical protein
MEGSPRAERYCLRSFEEDQTDHGFMTHHQEEPLQIERSYKNAHFFHWNTAHDRFELNYTGSAEVVHLLDVHLLVDARLQEDGRPARPISFYKDSGEFYDSVVVHDVAVVDGKNFGPKHVAVFQPIQEDEKPFAVPIDDIYCLGLPLPETDPSESS